MIRIIFRGGLGNQMFQYAAGYHLAKIHNTGLILDTSWYHYPINRKFLLNRFNVEGQMSGSWLRWPLLVLPNQAPVITARNRRKVIPRNQQESFDEFIKAGADSILFGMFVGERYFLNIADEVRHLYSLEHIELPEASTNFLKQINDSESVCIHVRLGDYLKYPEFNICGPSYYENAIRFMQERLSTPRFFVFSDDPAMCRDMLRNDQLIYWTGNQTGDPLIDLRLMSACKHHIASNSTFSWWGAWLAKTAQEKLVTAPSPWIKGLRDTSDICPESWHLISV